MAGILSCPAMFKPAVRKRGTRVIAGLVLVAGVTGCDLLTVSQTGRKIREGNEAVLRGEFPRAVQYYEEALDGTMLSAEAHYRLGLVYEDQLKNQVGALHHFERYLELAPQGQFATDVKGYVDRLRLVIVSSLAEGTVLPAREASRLKNENLELRQKLTELRQEQPAAARAVPKAPPVPPPSSTPPLKVAATPPPLPRSEVPEPEVRRAIPVVVDGRLALQPTASATPAAAPATATGPRSHTVVSGDTLAKMSRKYYGNSGQWPKILEANKGTLDDPKKLQPGMVLVIPE
jgi:tetratricopeptide (TPR) repeat protein